MTRYTFRKAVVTQIAETPDSETAAKQLATRGGTAERHNIASPQRAPDSSAVLEQGRDPLTTVVTLNV